jgi:hypothetical protein
MYEIQIHNHNPERWAFLHVALGTWHLRKNSKPAIKLLQMVLATPQIPERCGRQRCLRFGIRNHPKHTGAHELQHTAGTTSPCAMRPKGPSYLTRANGILLRHRGHRCARQIEKPIAKASTQYMRGDGPPATATATATAADPDPVVLTSCSD